MLSRLLWPGVLLGLVAAAPAAPLRVLILSGSNNHDWATTTPALVRVLTDSGRFTADVTENPASLTPATLAPYDLILSNWTNWPSEERVWGEAAEGAVLDFVRGGKGFALVHAASACFGGWPEYQQLVGATWDKAATGHGAIHEFAVAMADRDHPITRGLSEFRVRDELWHKMAVQPAAHVLCTAFSAPEQAGTGRDEPIALTTTLGQGRGFHSILGHDAATMEDLDWRLLMLRGAEWAATGRVTITSPLDADRALAGIVSYRRHESRAQVRVVEQVTQLAAAHEAQREALRPKLVALLRSTEATDDCQAVVLQQLALIGSGREVPEVTALLEHETLGDYALFALQRIPGEKAEAALLAATEGLTGPRRIGAVNALGVREATRAVRPLIGLLSDADDGVVLAAIDALGRIGGPAAVKALTGLPESRWAAAADALLSCADRRFAAGEPAEADPLYQRLATLPYADPVRTAAFAGHLRCLQAGQAEAVIEGLADRDPTRRAGAARALREARDSDLAGRVAARLPALAPEAQGPALDALYEVADGAAVAPLLPLVASPDVTVRMAAARLVGRFGGAAAWPALLEALRAAPDAAERAGLEATLSRVAGRLLAAEGALPTDLAAESPETRASLLRALGRLSQPAALELALAEIDDPTVSQEACAAAINIAERLPAAEKPTIQAALEQVMAASRGDERTRTRARTVLLGLGIPVEVTRSVALQDPGPNLALTAIASSPDDVDSDGAASGDQAGIDGDPATYWDEVNDQPLYRFKVAFPQPTEVAALRIMGHQQHMHSPKDFEILCDDQVVLTVRDAWYENNQFAIAFPKTTCSTLELKITGGYGPSPAIRELELFGRP